jgi:hypothetical protein
MAGRDRWTNEKNGPRKTSFTRIMTEVPQIMKDRRSLIAPGEKMKLKITLEFIPKGIAWTQGG